MTREERIERKDKLKAQCWALVCGIPTAYKWFFPPAPNGIGEYQDSPEYQQALEDYRKFEQQDGVSYEPVLTYARELAVRYEENGKAIEEKADAIIKYLGGGVAVLSLGAVLSVKVDTSRSVGLALAVLVAFIPSLYYAIRAVTSAVKVREPQGAASFPSVKFAVKMAEHHKVKEKLEVNLWLIFGPLCEAILRRNEKKAHYAKEAHRFYVSCLKWTALPVCVIIAVLVFMLIFPPAQVPAPPTSAPAPVSTSLPLPPSGSGEVRP